MRPFKHDRAPLRRTTSIPSSVETRVTVTYREPMEEHKQSTRATNVNAATAAVAQAASLGWLTNEEAGRMWRGLAGVARPDEALEGGAP